jgi:hypothetical protein
MADGTCGLAAGRMLREAAVINKQIAGRRAPDWEFFAG